MAPSGATSSYMRLSLIISACSQMEAVRVASDHLTHSNIFEAKEISAVSDKLWDGMDLEANELQELKTTSPHFMRAGLNVSKTLSSTKTKLYLLGPQHAGTHLLRYTLDVNFAQQVNDYCDSIGDGTHCGIWKHGLSDASHDLYDRIKEQGHTPEDALAVIVIRSPLSLLDCWARSPLDTAGCTYRKLKQFDTPCTATVGWKGNGGQDCDPPGAKLSFQSTMALYNQYMRMYQKLLKDGRLRGLAVTTYEDLVMDPDKAIQNIGKRLNWPLDKVQKAVIDEPHRLKALKKLQERSYINALRDFYAIEDGAWTHVCEDIDQDAIADFQEGSYSSTPKPYLADCQALTK